MKLYFRESGQGQTLVILHGLLGMSDHWIPLAKQFAEHFHVVVPDLRNHGRSPHAEDFSYKYMKSDIEELLSDIQIKSCNFLGHSMGGKLAMHIALSCPEIVDKLIVADISPVEYSPDKTNDMMQTMNRMNLSALKNREELQQMIQMATKDIMLQKLILKNISKHGISNFFWKPDMESITKNLQEVYNFNWRGFKNNDSEPILSDCICEKAGFNKETLFIKGGNSPYISENHYLEIAALFPQSKIVTIEDAGHWLHAEKPSEFYEVCIHFLR